MLGHIAPDRLESALRVGEAHGEDGAQEGVVATRGDLSFGAAHHPGTGGQAGADGYVGVAGEQRGHERQQRRQFRGQVHVHVGEYGGR